MRSPNAAEATSKAAPAAARSPNIEALAAQLQRRLTRIAATAPSADELAFGIPIDDNMIEFEGEIVLPDEVAQRALPHAVPRVWKEGVG